MPCLIVSHYFIDINCYPKITTKLESTLEIARNITKSLGICRACLYNKRWERSADPDVWHAAFIILYGYGEMDFSARTADK
jgi:hypothetical protein